MKGRVSFIFGIIGITISFFLKESEFSKTILKISLGIIVAVLIDFIVFIIENRKRINILKTLIIKRNQPISGESAQSGPLIPR